jgi:hypothetical protein
VSCGHTPGLYSSNTPQSTRRSVTLTGSIANIILIATNAQDRVKALLNAVPRTCQTDVNLTMDITSSVATAVDFQIVGQSYRSKHEVVQTYLRLPPPGAQPFTSRHFWTPPRVYLEQTLWVSMPRIHQVNLRARPSWTFLPFKIVSWNLSLCARRQHT